MSNTLNTLRKRNTLSNWAILLGCAIYFLPTLLMSHLWIDTKSVFIQDSYVGDETIMIVDRDIKINFPGHYTVTIYRNGDQFVCQSKSPSSIAYDKDKKLPEPLHLSWWLGGKDILQKCIHEGYTSGVFRVNTCHIVLFPLWEIPVAKSCKMSNKFARAEKVKKDG